MIGIDEHNRVCYEGATTVGIAICYEIAYEQVLIAALNAQGIVAVGSIKSRPRSAGHGQQIVPIAREHGVAGRARHRVAAAAQPPRVGGVAPAVAHDGEAPERLGQHRILSRGLRCGDRRFVRRDRFGDPGRPLSGATFVEQVRRGHQATA